MNPIQFALRHPITVLVGVLAIISGSILAGSRVKVDVFPSLNLPSIVIAQPYGGMSPPQIEALMTYFFESHFFYVNGIHHVEAKNIQSYALLKVYFQPGTDMPQAMSEVVAAVNRARAFMPPGSVPPFVARVDTDTAVVGYLVISSESRSITEIQDFATQRVRPMFASIDGISSPPAFGGNQKAVVIGLDPEKLRSLNLTPEDVTNAVASGNPIVPPGNVRVNDLMYLVNTNAAVGKSPAKELGDIAVRTGLKPVFLRDVADINDHTSDIATGYVLVDGRRSNYMLVTKRANASTLDVVNRLKAELPRLRETVPEDVKLDFIFDQSPIVTNAMWGVGIEGAIGAMLTGLMVLIFLKDWRSVIVVVLNIPLAILAAVIGLWLSGNTINIMSLGGLALAVGILVDEATVEVENIHTQMEKTDSIAQAVRRGNAETAVPRLLAMLCILAVFLPSFFMEGSAKALFIPLSLAVGFAMIASYMLSSTFVPVVSVWLLKNHKHFEADKPSDSRIYQFLLNSTIRLRFLVVPIYLAAAGLAIFFLTTQVGLDIFPRSDNGQFQLRLRPTGTRIERTEEIMQQALKILKEEIGANNIANSVGYVGMIPSSYPVQALYQWTSGPEEAFMKVALKAEAKNDLAAMKEKLRSVLPQKLGVWLTNQWTLEGLSSQEIENRLNKLQLSFEPADIINEVMSFGAPTPLEIVISSPKIADSIEYAEKVRQQLSKIKALRDLKSVQPQDYPTIDVKIDRQKAAMSNLTTENISNALIAATSSSRFMRPIYWPDPATGHSYLIQIQVPIQKMNSSKELGMTVVRSNNHGGDISMSDTMDRPSLLLRDVATVTEKVTAGEIDRYNMRRYISLVANVEGEDLGRLRKDVERAIVAAGEKPRGLIVDIRGQLEPLSQIIKGLSFGLLMAILIIFLLLSAYFQSFILGLISVTSIPAALTGVGLILWISGNTLNLQSFMGAIMVMGVATANAILLVTFAERARRANGGDARAAARDGAKARFRAILMTSCAMLVGMVPMGFGFTEGGEQAKPLGLAVIGGLIFSTLSTLLLLPSIFALLRGRSGIESASLDPYDPASSHYDPSTAHP